MAHSNCIGLPTHALYPFAAAVDWTKLDWANLWELVAAAAILAILVAVAVYIAGKVRNQAAQKEPPASELLTKFREMHSGGVLSDEEFRTIKTALTERLQNEIKNQDNAG